MQTFTIHFQNYNNNLFWVGFLSTNSEGQNWIPPTCVYLLFFLKLNQLFAEQITHFRVILGPIPDPELRTWTFTCSLIHHLSTFIRHSVCHIMQIVHILVDLHNLEDFFDVLWRITVRNKKNWHQKNVRNYNCELCNCPHYYLLFCNLL